MKSKKTSYADAYDASTGTVNIKGMWSDLKFRNLITDIGLSKISKVVIHNGGTLHLKQIELGNIEIHQYGFLSALCCMLSGINSAGIVRARATTIRNMENHGQMYVSKGTKLMQVLNQRHIELSKSYAYELECSEISSLKATNSWLVNCSAHTDTSLCISTARSINGSGSLALWSSPSYDDKKAIKPYLPGMRLLFAAVDLISQSTLIDSKTVITNKRVQATIKFIDSMLKKKYTLPYEVADDLISTVHCLSDAAQDNLRHTVGYRGVY